jgi:hypothetical protein
MHRSRREARLMPVREDASAPRASRAPPEPLVLGGAGTATAVVAAGSVQGIEPPGSERERVPGGIETEVVAEALSVGQVPLMVASHRERDVPESSPRGVVALLIVAQRTVRILVVPEGQDGASGSSDRARSAVAIHDSGPEPQMSPAAKTAGAPRGGGETDGSGVATPGSSGCRPPAAIAAKSRTAPRPATTERATIPVRRPSCTQR